MKDKLRPGDFTLTQISNQELLLEHRDGTKTQILMKVDDSTGEVYFDGLPAQF